MLESAHSNAGPDDRHPSDRVDHRRRQHGLERGLEGVTASHDVRSHAEADGANATHDYIWQGRTLPAANRTHGVAASRRNAGKRHASEEVAACLGPHV